MNLYRNKDNGFLYIIEHLIYDIRFMNCNAFAGIYARPYKWKGQTIRYTINNKPFDEPFNPLKFVEDNFEKVTELRHL